MTAIRIPKTRTGAKAAGSEFVFARIMAARSHAVPEAVVQRCGDVQVTSL
jgi:hypothetical protein